MNVLLIAYNNGDYIHHFPLGLGYVAAKMEEEGHDVEIWQQDIHRWKPEELTIYLNIHQFDMVGIGVCAGYYQYKVLLELSKAIRKAKDPIVFIIGGHGPAADPEYFKKVTGADIVIDGEYEGDPVDVNKLSHPARHLFNMDYYSLLRLPGSENNDITISMVTGRGCPYKCNFCYRMVPGFRPRKTSLIMDEIETVKMQYDATYISFEDELLMSSIRRIEEFCAEIKRHNVKWKCSGRLNFATKSITKLMKSAGCVHINYGIESMNDEMLKRMNKNLTVKQIICGVNATIKAGIIPGLNIIFGNVGETLDTLWKGVDFLKDYGDGSQLRTVRPVTPYPGCDLYKYAIEKGMIKDCADFYENKHKNSDLITCNFTDIDDDRFYYELNKANKELIEDYFAKKTQLLFDQTDDLYDYEDTTFRGYRQT